MRTCYTRDTIRIWIARAEGRAPKSDDVDRQTCADIAMAMLMYNQLYIPMEKQEEIEDSYKKQKDLINDK